jgi:hypothetical protein
MRKSALHIGISLFLSFLFLFAGTGFNIIQFCCHDCKLETTESNIELSYAFGHDCHHHHENEMIVPIAQHIHDKSHPEHCSLEIHKGCSLERITVDTPVISIPTNEITPYDFIFLVLDNSFTTSTLLSLEEKHTISFPTFTDPVNLEGREILAQSSILII